MEAVVSGRGILMESQVLKWEMFKLMCLALYLSVCGTVRDVQESTQGERPEISMSMHWITKL